MSKDTVIDIVALVVLLGTVMIAMVVVVRRSQNRATMTQPVDYEGR